MEKKPGGWPRRNEGARLYQENKDKSYILVIVENGLSSSGSYDSIGNAYEGPNPSLCGCTASPDFLLNRCKRVEWSALPEEWQKAFRRTMEQNEWDTTPETTRGFWRVNNIPKPETV